MTISFLAPLFLWLATALPLLWLMEKGPRLAKRTLLRALVLLLLILGLARPVIHWDEEAPRHVVILDSCTSLEEGGSATLRQITKDLIAEFPDDAIVTVIDMAEVPRDLGPLAADIDQLINWDAKVAGIPAALQLALKQIPKGSPAALTLISDGLSQDLSWGDAMAALTARGIPLHSIALNSSQGDARPVDLKVPSLIREGHRSYMQVKLQGFADQFEVSLWDDGVELAKRSGLSLNVGGFVRLEFEPQTAGYRNLIVKLNGTRAGARISASRSLRVAIQKPLRVLYLGDRIRGSAESLAQMLGKGFSLQSPNVEVDNFPREGFDLVMIDDCPASNLPESWKEGIAEAVRNRGVGLLASGGRAAFGAGGYAKTPIEDLLPVELVQKEEKKDPSTTLAIIIDTSGSMVGNRMTLAKQVARLAMRRLQPHDKVGIVEFYGTKQWAAPIQSAANQIDLQRAVNRLGASGGTVLLPAVEEAYYALKNVQTRYKHVLILTDAGVETGPYERVLRRMSDEGMTVSTVLVGPGRHSEFLVELADWGGGRYYNAANRFNLPELLLKRPSTSVLPSYRPESVEIETQGGPGWLGDLDPKTVPPLAAFVDSKLKPRAEILMTTRDKKKPILASWPQGLGRVTALMTEPTGPGTKSWGKWDGFGPFLGRVMTRTARGAQEPFEFSLRRRGREMTVTAARRIRAELTPVIHRLDQVEAERSEIPLVEVAPGIFEARFDWRPDLDLDLHAEVKGQEPTRQYLTSGAFADVSPRDQVDTADRFPFHDAASLSGGQVHSDQNSGFGIKAASGSAPRALTPLSTYLLLLALVAFLSDIFLRRKVWPAGGAI